MKKINNFVVLGLIITLVACGSWKEEEEDKYMNECLISFADSDIPDSLLVDYCTCTLEKIQAEFEAENWKEQVSAEKWENIDTLCLKEVGLSLQTEALPEVMMGPEL